MTRRSYQLSAVSYQLLAFSSQLLAGESRTTLRTEASGNAWIRI